jgi:hypothetical protein
LFRAQARPPKTFFCVFFDDVLVCAHFFFKTLSCAGNASFARARALGCAHRTPGARTQRVSLAPHTLTPPPRAHTHTTALARHIHTRHTHSTTTQNTLGQPRGAPSSVSLRFGDRSSSGVLIGCRWGAWRAWLAQAGRGQCCFHIFLFQGVPPWRVLGVRCGARVLARAAYSNGARPCVPPMAQHRLGGAVRAHVSPIVFPVHVKGIHGQHFMPSGRVRGCPARPHDMHVIDQTCTYDDFMHVDDL